MPLRSGMAKEVGNLKRFLRLTLVVCALLATCSVAWAQGSSASALWPKIVGSIGAPDIITGTVVPFLIMVVAQTHWTWKAKANAAWIICLIAAVAVSALQRVLSGDWTAAPVVVAKFSLILTVAKNIYDGAYKPLGIADALTQATNLTKPSTLQLPDNILDETPL